MLWSICMGSALCIGIWSWGTCFLMIIWKLRWGILGWLPSWNILGKRGKLFVELPIISPLKFFNLRGIAVRLIFGVLGWSAIRWHMGVLHSNQKMWRILIGRLRLEIFRFLTRSLYRAALNKLWPVACKRNRIKDQQVLNLRSLIFLLVSVFPGNRPQLSELRLRFLLQRKIVICNAFI